MGWLETTVDAEGNVTERYKASDTLLIVRLKAALGDEYREKSSIQHDLSPALATLMATWQELRAHPEHAHSPMPGPGEAMLQLGEHADWMDAELEDSSPSAGEVGDELMPDWAVEQEQAPDERQTSVASDPCACCGDETGRCSCFNEDWCATCYQCLVHCRCTTVSHRVGGRLDHTASLGRRVP